VYFCAAPPELSPELPPELVDVAMPAAGAAPMSLRGVALPVPVSGGVGSEELALGEVEPDSALPVEVPSDVTPEPDAGAAAPGGGTVRSLWQYRHLIASSWISSAQYGHFFTVGLHVLWHVPSACSLGTVLRACQLTAAGQGGSSLG
jgi:hypothetical protein